MTKVANALAKHFEQHKLIFWYDEKQEFEQEFEQLNTPGIEKVRIQNNEFALRYQISKSAEKEKFLLYFPEGRPANDQHWLLDLELAHFVFQTDQKAVLLQDLNLPSDFAGLIQEHLEFFKAKERLQKLQAVISEDESMNSLHLKMLQQVFKSKQASLDHFLWQLTKSFLEEENKIPDELKRFKLEKVLWKLVEKRYGYQSETPGIYDFMVEVFQENSPLFTQEKKLSGDSGLLLWQWQDSQSMQAGFYEMSKRVAEDLQVATKAEESSLQTLLKDNLFRKAEQHIVLQLAENVHQQALPHDQVLSMIKQRENKCWYPLYADYYQCILQASRIISLQKALSKEELQDFSQGISLYSNALYQVDMAYRHFLQAWLKIEEKDPLAALFEVINKRYANDWLLPLNNQWQKVLDRMERLPLNDTNQQGFYTNYVAPFPEQGKRLFVIVSDALRFECGKELQQKILQENRFEAGITPLFSALPSYTQLGMAALLPHKNSLSIKAGSDAVQVGEITAMGLEGRTKILQQNSAAGERAGAITADNFLNLNRDQGREYVKQYDLIYVYHNQIDKTGDDKTTEQQVPAATAETMNTLLQLVKKITNLNGNNIFITADHGFLYQASEVQESDYCATAAEDKVIWKKNRRFIIGQGLPQEDSAQKWNSEQLGLKGEAEFLLPKSVNRYRISGAGARFIHGGASLQEMVIPLIKISKKRSNTVKAVEIDIIRSVERITTGALAVSFMQSEPVSQNCLAQKIRAGIYSQDGVLLSDVFTYNFDSEAAMERQREQTHHFKLNYEASARYKNQQVALRLETPVEGTSKWTKYKEFFYTMNISIPTDF
ncbi:BREX-1 system phosphatase PglZ type A [Persicobacter sp. CCB-QB2]|uniref:BREX-1 system phosphatase PglZ type A n=1 Tax=Persicobacter sp. CCB-QB2 TaxID=1561025 RepID=UPI0006A9C800|nr:BREX-1 system phosphatase PglZ type A [Persicobacter sp. CCB-QB2]